MAFNKAEELIIGLPVLKDNIIWLWIEGESVVVIDPALSKPVSDWINKNNLRLDSILQTHHHSDHIGGTAELKREWPNVKIIASDKEKIRIPLQNFSVNDGDTIKILNKNFKIIELVGHTKSHIAFYSEEFNKPRLFVGDTLFSGGCGRIFEGTYEQMYNSLKIICDLPKDTLIYCAHEYTYSNLLWALNIKPKDKQIKNKLLEVQKRVSSNKLTIPTTLKEEMKINLFLRAKNLEEFRSLRANKDVWV
tara:strand:- start:566 stop:1312 length:747 start_codon:yes stop_codon:yes gene_type:complete